MPFVKLDCGMLNSTIWIDREAREVFITALLMAEPFYTEIPLAQLEVRLLAETGWSVPPGDYGFIRAAGVGIVRQSGVDNAEGLDALERLGAPEQESRNPAHEGRRLVRVDGGFVVLNYDVYRERDYTAADRQKRYRERIKAKANGVTPPLRENVTVTRNITQAEAEAEVEGFKSKRTTARRAAPRDDPDWFVEFKSVYPPRAGDQGWRKALRAAHQRIAEGHQPREFADGARRYAAFVLATDNAGTQFVKQAATFLGPDKHFTQLWGAPPLKESLYDAMMRENNGGEPDHDRSTLDADTYSITTALAASGGNVRG